jgi:hypothetical protein
MSDFYRYNKEQGCFSFCLLDHTPLTQPYAKQFLGICQKVTDFYGEVGCDFPEQWIEEYAPKLAWIRTQDALERRKRQ